MKLLTILLLTNTAGSNYLANLSVFLNAHSLYKLAKRLTSQDL